MNLNESAKVHCFITGIVVVNVLRTTWWDQYVIELNYAFQSLWMFSMELQYQVQF